MRQLTILLLMLALLTAPALITAQTECPSAPFQRGDVLVVNPGQAQNVRARPTTTANIIASVPQGEYLTVWNGPECADGYTWWRVNYGQQVGWTAEAPNDGNADWLSKVTLKTYEAGNVRLSAPETLVTGFTFIDEGEGGGDGFSTPPRRTFTIEGFPISEGRKDIVESPPAMWVYPCAQSDQNSDFASSCSVGRSIPILPATDNLIAFDTMPKGRLAEAYFSFASGNGVRRVFYFGARYGYDQVSPLMGYGFTALTTNGDYQISVYFPIEVNWTPPPRPFILPQSEVFGSRGFDHLYRGYLLAANQMLIDLPPEAFTPRLALLDAMMRSIEITGEIELHPEGR